MSLASFLALFDIAFEESVLMAFGTAHV